MNLLADWSLKLGGKEHRIELLWGDLSYLPPNDAVDILVVSAFPNDYIPTPSSLIGALHRNGISVHTLSFAKEWDMRSEFSCWLSEPLVGVRSFRRILCVESGWRGKPPEIADDLFRAIAACSMTERRSRSIAMPLIGTGDQGYPADQVLESVLRAAVSWFRRGLPVDVLKIVAYSAEVATAAKRRFLELKQFDTSDGNPARPPPDNGKPSAGAFDVFLSYAHEDSEAAEYIHRSLLRNSPGIRIFFDKKTMTPGTSWLMQIADSLDNARRVVAIYTPDYWASKYCKDEFSAAYVRQADTGASILLPLHFRASTIPYLFQTVQYKECREADLSKVSDACRELCDSFGRPPAGR